MTRGWSIFALYDGTYLGGEYGGVIKDGTPGGAFNLKTTFCIMTTRNTGQPRNGSLLQQRPAPLACSPAPTAGYARSSEAGNRSLAPAPAHMTASTGACTAGCGRCLPDLRSRHLRNASMSARKNSITTTRTQRSRLTPYRHLHLQSGDHPYAGVPSPPSNHRPGKWRLAAAARQCAPGVSCWHPRDDASFPARPTFLMCW